MESSNRPTASSAELELFQSVAEHLKDGKSLTYDLGGTASCTDVGISIANRLATHLKEL